MRRAESGFTLLEVLAAVALLAILFTTLARVGIQGLRAEGESRRRLEASLVADEVLGEIELAMAAGAMPELGVQEREVDDYSVHIEVKPFAQQGTEYLLGMMHDPDAPPPQTSGPTVVSAEGATVLAPPDNPEDEPVRLIEVRVSWLEADEPRSVLRTTYAYDVGSLAAQAVPEDAQGTTQDTRGTTQTPQGLPQKVQTERTP